MPRIGARLFGIAGAGITTVTASFIRIQRSANPARLVPAGTASSVLRRPEVRSRAHAREGLADVECLTVAVEIAVIVRGKFRVARDLAGQQPLASGTRTMTATFCAWLP